MTNGPAEAGPYAILVWGRLEPAYIILVGAGFSRPKFLCLCGSFQAVPLVPYRTLPW